jgi:hypothetical protein
VATLVRTLAITAAVLVALGFATFATDQSREGSDNQVQALDGSQPRNPADNEINRPVPPPNVERRRELKHSDFRELIDDANDYLLAPFTVVNSSNVWVERMTAAGLGLLVYGLLGMLLANMIPQHRSKHHSWTETAS